ncbi:uncharacterized protein [Phyllobates terribilis]|uniref:uncharacterized protein n=1 Tax=Phyllobates terribilis TaxID=111132 RepID=UPI003CCABF80
MEIFGMDFGCALNLLRNGEIPAKGCLLPLISKLLGYTLVAASTTVKLPQILKILKHKSARGLSPVSFELEVIGYTIGLSYCLHKGLPFSTYGEYVIILTQALILVSITYYYSRPVKMATWIRALLYYAIAPTVLSGKLDPMLFEALYACQHAIFLSARTTFLKLPPVDATKLPPCAPFLLTPSFTLALSIHLPSTSIIHFTICSRLYRTPA